MGFFKKITRAVSRVAKLAKVTAPLWSSFIPGGSIAAKLMSRTGIGAGSGANPLGKIMAGIHQVKGLRPRGVPGAILNRRRTTLRRAGRINQTTYRRQLALRQAWFRKMRRLRRAS